MEEELLDLGKIIYLLFFYIDLVWLILFYYFYLKINFFLFFFGTFFFFFKYHKIKKNLLISFFMLKIKNLFLQFLLKIQIKTKFRFFG